MIGKESRCSYREGYVWVDGKQVPMTRAGFWDSWPGIFIGLAGGVLLLLIAVACAVALFL